MQRQQPNAVITLAIGLLLAAIAVVLPMSDRPRYVVMVVGIGLILL